MSEVPDPLRPLNILVDAVTVAHETIYDLHRRLVSSDRATPETRSLLAESAEIALRSAPEATATVRQLAGEWHEQSVLYPAAAEQTALQLENELAHAESLLRQLLTRETTIAATLRTLAADSC